MTLAAFNNELKTKQKLQQRSLAPNSLQTFTLKCRPDNDFLYFKPSFYLFFKWGIISTKKVFKKIFEVYVN